MRYPPSSTSHPVIAMARGRRGFSLVEALVTVAILGVLATLGIGAYSGIHRGLVEKATNQRNAQEIVSLGVCATVGSAKFVVAGDKAATVQNLVDGTLGTSGVWKGKIFRLSMTPETMAGALSYIKFVENLLLYEPTGNQGQH